jgi:hypothetical protein
LPLRRNLLDSHFNFACALNEFLEFFCHRVLSRFKGDVIYEPQGMATSSLLVLKPT